MAVISHRAQQVDSSGIRRVFDLAATLKDPVNLSIGQPDFDAFEQVKHGAKRAIDQGHNRYTLTQGLTELRVKLLNRIGLGPDCRAQGVDLFITSGVSGGLLLSYFALLDPGDEILIPDPFFCMYRDLALLLNAVPTYYDTYADFCPSVDRIEEALTSKTKAILINTPANPTGYAWTEQEIESVIDLARQKGLWIIYDEIYELFSYDKPHVSIFGKYEKTIVLNGFSKSHGVPGWRVGYAVGPVEVIDQMLKIQQYSFVCAPSIAQWGLVDGLDTEVNEIVTAYRKKRDFIADALQDKFSLVRPGGAFYLFPEAPGGSGQEFVERCITNSLLVVPGHVFSRRDTHFRISFASPMKELERGVEILRRLI